MEDEPSSRVVDSLKRTKNKCDLSGTNEFGFISKIKQRVNPIVAEKRWNTFLIHALGSEWAPSDFKFVGKSLNQFHQLVREGQMPISIRSVAYTFICKITDEQILEYRNMPPIKLETCDKTIEKDLLRTLPGNIFFLRVQDEGTQRLRRILNRTKSYIPEYGYCQGMGLLVAHLLLIMEEESVFYVSIYILRSKLPTKFFTPDLTGLRAEQAVLRSLVKQKLPRLDQFLASRSVDISFFSIQWLVTLLAGVLPVRMLYSVWDILLLDGICVIHSVALSILKYFEIEIVNLPATSDVFKFLADLPIRIRSEIEIKSLNDLGEQGLVSVTEEMLTTRRKREINAIKSATVENKEIKLQKSDVVPITQNYINLSPHLKQAEVVYSVRHAVDGICRHFGHDINTFLDFEDSPSFPIGTKNQSKVTLAVTVNDFLASNDDEINLQTNDLVEVWIKDIDYWYGKNTRSGDDGAFRAESVSLITSKHPYNAIVLTHGLRSKYEKCHPWDFFRLILSENKNRKIITTAQSINRSFDLKLDFNKDGDDFSELLYIIRVLDACSFATLDEKLFTFILHGLNRSKLHIYWNIIAGQDNLASIWYSNISFITSPGKNQITCLLAPLSHLPFHYQEEDRPAICMANSISDQSFLNDELRQFILKHHLFSWQI